MSNFRYKILPTGGSLLGCHFDSLMLACKAAKDLVSNQGYTSVEIVNRNVLDGLKCSFTLAIVKPNGVVDYPHLDNTIYDWTDFAKCSARHLRNLIREEMEIDPRLCQRMELWERLAHTIGPEIRAEESLCRKYLG